MRLRRPRPVVAAAFTAAVMAAAPTAASAQTATCTTPAAPARQAVAIGSGGAASTVDPLATSAAIDVLENGGNAIDATVAAAAVLGVTEPFSAGIGGGGFMVIRTADGEVTTIDGRETAPEAMNPRSFFENGEPLPFREARFSGLSAGVPGTVATWERALERYGTISLRRALRPGIRVACGGFEIDETFFSQVEANEEYFDDIGPTADLYLDPDGTPRDVGTVLRNPDMTRAYRRIAERGAAGFYRGPVARAIVRAIQDPPLTDAADHTWRPGVIDEADLRGYVAPERRPTRVGYRGYDVWGMGPPSSGGSTVGEILNILERFPVPSFDRAKAFHYLLEAERLAFADRNAFLGDTDFVDVPLRGLLSDSFAAERAALLPERAANAEVEPGDPWDNEGDEGDGRVRSDGGPGRGTTTTHLSVSDDEGNVVSYTFTIESTGGNGIVVPGWGFLLNNELTDFNYDLIGHPNSVAGGKRPRSSMSPTIVTRYGAPVLAVGSPGGSTIITTVAQILMDRLDLGTDLPTAIAFPRASQRNGPRSDAEPQFIDSELGRTLATVYGHEFRSVNEIGAATGIDFASELGWLMVAAAEPERRGSGSALVVDPAGIDDDE